MNSAGFLFQIAVKARVQAGFEAGVHKYRGRVHEHSWRRQDGSQHFIDVVAEHEDDVVRIIIECKRVAEGSDWVALVPDPRAPEREELSFAWALTVRPDFEMWDWSEWLVEPASHRAEFCQRGDGGEQVFLEKIGRELLDSAAALAEEELRRCRANEHRFVRFMYIPMLVTNARLSVGTFDPNAVDTRSGTIDHTQVTFEEVPLFRFQKSLPEDESEAAARTRRAAKSLFEANRQSTKSFLVVNAAALDSVLAQLEVRRPPDGQLWPWDAAMARLGGGRR